ncbi:MAG: thioredoxin domain-containing protein [Deltaproteobacteria bacterium]|nr:thioredoxin domain-containing protein [Deltaproteobacteria bacterium]MCB9786285.1 thioredoxin domain-containing protein [Deltaproteobacteria bacterium]
MARGLREAAAAAVVLWGCARPAAGGADVVTSPQAEVVTSAGGVAAAVAEAAVAPVAAPPPTAEEPRSPAQIRAEGNHLRGARSRYLQQHAHNPIDWYPWGPEALHRAERTGRPILLSVGYSSCHWCHVMEAEVFEHDEVASWLNAHFVCIKVDREERPDVDAIYMDAVQAMTGRGGWPMTLILTPDLRPFFAGTYLPRDRFMAVVQAADERWRGDREGVERDASRVLSQLSREPPAGGEDGGGASAVLELAARATASFDTTYGGFGGRMKFPTTARWRFLLHAWRKAGGDALEAGIRRTLDAMAAGGIHDALGGGFHRYTVEPTWLVPHFEKMLYDNAQLAALYFEAGAALGEPRYTAIGRSTLDFLLREMGATGGGFHASFDADSGGEEGSYYVWTRAELEAIVGPTDGRALAAILGVRSPGTFDASRSVLSRQTDVAEVARALGRAPGELLALVESSRPRLLEARAKRTPPHRDEKLVTSWNGLAISAFALGYRATGDARYREAAEATAELLWRLHRADDGSLLRVSNQGHAEHAAILDDYAFVAVGLLDLYEAIGSLSALRRARTLVDAADRRFARPEGGWYLAAAGDDSLLIRPFDPYDSARPSGNGKLLEAMLRLAAATGDPRRWERVDAAIRALSPVLARAGLGASGVADAVLELAGPCYEVVIAGDAGAPETGRLREVADSLLPAWAVTSLVAATGPTPEQLEALPALAGKDAGAAAARAFVCVRGACKQPTTEPRTLRQQLLAGWRH